MLFKHIKNMAVEWWFKNGMRLPARVMAEQTGAFLGRNLV